MPGLPLPLWYQERWLDGGATVVVSGGGPAQVVVTKSGGATVAVSGGGPAAIIVSRGGGATVVVSGGSAHEVFFQPTLFLPLTVRFPPHVAAVLVPEGNAVEVFDHVAVAIVPKRTVIAVVPQHVARTVVPEREMQRSHRRSRAEVPDHEAEAQTRGSSTAVVPDRRSTIS